MKINTECLEAGINLLKKQDISENVLNYIRCSYAKSHFTVSNRCKELEEKAGLYPYMTANYDRFTKEVDVGFDIYFGSKPMEDVRAIAKKLGVELSAKWNKSGTFRDDKPITSMTQAVEVDDVTYHFESYREGLPSSTCRIETSVSKYVVCDTNIQI